MKFRKLSFALAVVISSLVLLCSPAISGEYKNQSFPSDAIITAQQWQSPKCKPTRILGKQKLANDEYRLFYETEDGDMEYMTVIKLDTNLWLYLGAVGLGDGLFTDSN